ncbi:MAG TPA: sulfatase-like hydrolase/transferase [Bacteroidia bacterium]
MQTVKSYLSPYFPVFKVMSFALIAFTAYRLCFIFFNRESIPENPNDELFLISRALLYGVNFDLVIICYFTAPFLLFVFISNQFNYTASKGYVFFKWYLILSFTLFFLICAADIPFYKQFGGHLNKGFFVWTESPGFVLHLIFSNVAYWGYLLLFLILSFYFYRSTKRLFFRMENKQQDTRRPLSIALFLILALFTFIGIRGRTALKSPIRIGTAFFSEHAFYNQLGLNPCFVFFHSLMEDTKEWKFLNEPFTEQEQAMAMADIANEKKFILDNGIERTYTFDSLPHNYNVMVVLMESMSITKMGYYGCDHLTSRFDTLVSQGVFYNRFYSSGIHTFNGVFSTETGFPAIMNTHPLNTYNQKAFKGISYWLKKNGYSNYFFTSHDPQFDNMEGFLKFNDFDRVYSQIDYPSEEANGPLGVPDHYLLEYALEKMDAHHKEKNTPFFSYLLTSSDHGPWEIPTNIPFKPTAQSKQDKATQYADWAIGDFIQKAKKYDWFNNTLFVFVADHGGNLGHTYSMPLSYNHIPCLFYMPSQLRADTISSLGGQIDILPTVLSFLKIPFKNTSMGIDLMREKRPYMYFTADSKIGCIDEKYYYIHLLDEQKELLYEFKDLNMHSFYEEKKSKADSMKHYAYRMIRTANHIIKNKLY